MLSHHGTGDLAGRIDQQDARATGADIDSNQFHCSCGYFAFEDPLNSRRTLMYQDYPPGIRAAS
jgi:hypothetical protein